MTRLVAALHLVADRLAAGPVAANLLAAGLLAAGAPPAAAAGFDEFQIFDGRLAAPGSFGLNQYIVLGRRGRRGDGAPRNGLLATAEIAYATTTWHEVALYLPVAAEFSGDLFGGGAKLRNTFVLPGTAVRPFAGGFDVELRRQSYRFAESDWSVTLRPIIDLRRGPWQLILNPAFEMPLGRGGVAFVPASGASCRWRSAPGSALNITGTPAASAVGKRRAAKRNRFSPRPISG